MTTYVTKVQSNGKLKRGPCVSVPNREWSEPIPDELLTLIDAAKLVVDDNDHDYIVYYDGKETGVAWGPSVEGEWFVRSLGADARRVPTRDGALTVLVAEALSAR
jgi:hypothetical protein